jgi:hypothetical protein
MGTVPAPLSARTRFGQHRGGVPLLPLHHSSEQQVSAARQYLDKLRLQADEAEAHQRIASARVQVLQEEARILKDDALELSASARERDKQLWLTMQRRIEEAKELEEASVAAKHMADAEAERVLARVEQSKRGAELEWERVRARDSEIRALIAESLASDGITDSARDRLKQLLQTSYHPERSPSELSDSTPSGSARGSACNTPVSSTRGVVVGTSSAAADDSRPPFTSLLRTRSNMCCSLESCASRRPPVAENGMAAAALPAGTPAAPPAPPCLVTKSLSFWRTFCSARPGDVMASRPAADGAGGNWRGVGSWRKVARPP